jgi:hypothetical protein
MQVVTEKAVLSFFWILRFIRPMCDEGRGRFSRKTSVLALTQEEKESSDMKRTLLWAMALIVVVGLTGCMKHGLRRPCAATGGCCEPAAEGCQSCDGACGGGERCDGACEDSARGHRNADGPGFFRPGCLCGHGRNGGNEGYGNAGPAGPASGAVTYPYYTTRGPRDFLAKNPASIGP